MAKLKSNLKALMERWEKQSGGIKLTKAELARVTNVSRDTITRMYKGDMSRFDDNTVVALCKFFRCGIGDLITIDTSDEVQP